MGNCTGKQRAGGLLPMCRQAAAVGINDEVCQVLDITRFMLSAQPNLVERIEMY